jgi:hypothetical protein
MTRAEIDSSLKQAIGLGTPVEVFDPTTNERFYLLTAAQYELASAALSDEFNPAEAYSMIDEVMAEDDAHDPLLEGYQ